MNIKRSTLAVALSSALVAGFSGQASADLYAGSSLNIDNLSVAIGEVTTDNDGNITGINPSANGVDVTTFNFNLTNTASLSGVGDLTTAVCSGTPSSNSCNVAADAPDSLYAGAVNATGSDFLRTDKDYAGADSTFEWYGIATGSDWSSADSIIHDAQLTDGVPTDTDQIAESKITSDSSAAASSAIQSTTGFTFTFNVEGPDPVDILISFDADPDLYAEILNEILGGYDSYSASGDVSVSFTLTQNTGGSGFTTWAPNGTLDQNCFGNLACVEFADGESLNTNVGTTADNTNDQHSYGPNIPGGSAFGIVATNLTAGQWTLVLQAKTSTLLTHNKPVPEPGILSLMGLGLIGLGGAVRRRRRKV